jgi:magnesium-transporting ATPase (P-type)
MIVIAVSLLVEGFSDYKRHLNDHETNNADCVILRRSDELEAEEGAERDKNICKGKDVVVNMNKTYLFDMVKSMHRKDTDSSDGASTVRVAFQKVQRKDIRQGHFVLVKNREMVPADMVLLASSNDQGGAYIETSSIDGETNLKLRISPHLPKAVIQALREGSPMESITEEIEREKDSPPDVAEKQIETIDYATKRLTKFSYLGQPDGASVMAHPSMKDNQNANTANGVVLSATVSADEEDWGTGKRKLGQIIREGFTKRAEHMRRPSDAHEDVAVPDQNYITTLTTEPPNASVHTFSGKLTFPPYEDGGPCYELPLGADHVLLRGAVIRNTEWIIGLAFFTGPDTKLVQNSFETPSKFSQLDRLINKTVVAILVVMILCIVYLATFAIAANNGSFERLFYAGFNTNNAELWPYFPEGSITTPPKWETQTWNWVQYFLLYITVSL